MTTETRGGGEEKKKKNDRKIARNKDSEFGWRGGESCEEKEKERQSKIQSDVERNRGMWRDVQRDGEREVEIGRRGKVKGWIRRVPCRASEIEAER